MPTKPGLKSCKEFVFKSKGYTSYFNALRRIPFEEGPYFLFKNSSPIFLKNFLGTYTIFYTFDFIKDKASWMWRVLIIIFSKKITIY